MAKVCEVCGKGPSTGNKVSHSNKKTRRRWLPNLQHVKVKKNNTTVRLRVCTRCLRTEKVAGALVPF